MNLESVGVVRGRSWERLKGGGGDLVRECETWSCEKVERPW